MNSTYVRRITMEAYNGMASKWSKLYGVNIPEDIINHFSNLIISKGPILDIGCGPGRDSKFMKENKLLEITGIDSSVGMINIAKQNCKTVSFTTADMLNLPFRSEVLAGLYAMSSIFHTPKKDAKVLLGEFNRVLLPNGILFIGIREGNGENMLELDGFPPRYYAFYTQSEMESLLTSTGFRILNTRQRSFKNAKWLDFWTRKQNQ